MSFNSGTIAADALASTTLQTAIDAALTTHPAWDLVEVVGSTDSPGTSVWKCLGTFNTHAQDFFVAFHRSTNILMYVNVAELYNSSTDVFTGYAPLPSGSTLTPGSAGRTNGTPAATISVTSTGIATMVSPSLTLSATSFNWYLSVTNDRIVIGTTAGATDSGLYVGGYESFFNTTLDPFPLVCGKIVTTGMQVATAAFTRELTPYSAAATWAWSSYIANFENPFGPGSISSQKDHVLDQWMSTPVVVGSGSFTTGRQNGRGLLRDVRNAYPGASPTNGDTVTINSGTWTYIKNGAGSTINGYCVRNAA